MRSNHPDKNRFILAGGALCVALSLPLAGLALSAATPVAAAEHGGAQAGSGSGGAGRGGPGESGQGGQHAGGGKGGGITNKIFRPAVGEEEDSDRPEWAGVKGGKAGGGGKPFGAGVKKGDLYGDMYVLLRDENGEPLLDESGAELVVAFIYEGTTLVPLLDGTSLVAIPRNEEGDLLTQVTLGDTTYDVYPAEVELGRLSVSRSPSKVLDHSLDEAIAKLASAEVIALDATGRLTADGVTIDSPLENLALYVSYMTSGTLPQNITLPEAFDAAALLAAAADKTGSISVDTVIYMNSILGINSGETYYDFSTYEYDREATWSDKTVQVLVFDEANNVYVPTTVNLYEVVFGSTVWSDPTTDGGADDFAAAANDYLQAIEFVHDNEVR